MLMPSSVPPEGELKKPVPASFRLTNRWRHPDISAQNVSRLKVLKTKIDLNAQHNYVFCFKIQGVSGFVFILIPPKASRRLTHMCMRLGGVEPNTGKTALLT